MIVHRVTIAKPTRNQNVRAEYKKIYVGCADADIRYRDMMVSFKQRWETYTNSKFDFLSCDRSGLESGQWKPAIENLIRGSSGVMILVSEHTALDTVAQWEIDCAVSNNVSIVGVDIRKNPEANIPKKLAEKMTRYGWEWFAEFIDGI
jgi:hypothetical protein